MSRSGWDQQITVFSPDGHLFQVEYAFNAVKLSGVTTVAVCGKDTAVVVTERKVGDRLLKSGTVSNVYPLDGKLGLCCTGRVPDGRLVANEAREMCAEFKYDNGRDIPIGLLAKRLGGRAQLYTQKAGVRAMGTMLTVLGMDRDDATGAHIPKLYKVDPAGQVFGYFATACGEKETDAVAQLEKAQKKKPFGELDDDETTSCALEVLQHITGGTLKAADVEMAAVTAARPDFHAVPSDRIETLLTAIAERD